MSDFRLCAWPPPLDPADASVAGALDALNDTRQEWGAFLHKLRHGTRAERESPILSFSHFLPRLELCPEKRMLFYPNLPKAVGSDFILARIAPLATHGLSPERKPEQNAHAREHVHVFGHTHFGWDQTLDGVRYVQAPVSYPHEWRQRPGSLAVGPDATGRTFDLSVRTADTEEIETPAREASSPVDDLGGRSATAAPLCVWDEVGSPGDGVPGSIPARRARRATFGFVPEMTARWSDHYKSTPRDPENTELAWWVKGGRKSR
jgi:hypothetical protein